MSKGTHHEDLHGVGELDEVHDVGPGDNAERQGEDHGTYSLVRHLQHQLPLPLPRLPIGLRLGTGLGSVSPNRRYHIFEAAATTTKRLSYINLTIIIAIIIRGHLRGSRQAIGLQPWRTAIIITSDRSRNSQ